MDSLGKRLRELRLAKELSQSELARSADVSNEYIGKIEREEASNIGIETIDAIAKALAIHPSLLLYGEILTPTYQFADEIWPLKEDEKLLVENYRKITSKAKREAVLVMCRAVSDQS